ncbi:MAG: glycosyltransferase [Nitrospirae bacterium]|nr:glycosyltransferase [Nitrospirota bacterium]MBF0535090.1 glycosyltransferase [Nitrospirota bacterium]MBF0615360.1 glycosyltransferase [Nitrospirota bacterium]
MIKNKLAIIIPVFNEAENISATISVIENTVKTPHVIYIVYDNDDDNTVPVVKALKENGAAVELLKNPQKGACEAIKWGLKTAIGDYKLVTMADMSDDYGDVDKMCSLMDAGFDLVCGSRYCKGGKQIGGGIIKKTMSRTAGLTLKLLAGVPTYDATNSFKLYRSTMLDTFEIQSDGGFEIGLEIIAKAYTSGYKITEVPTTWKDREKGQSRFKIIQWLPKYLKWYFYAISH